MVVKDRVGRKRYILVEIISGHRANTDNSENLSEIKITRSGLIYNLNREFNKYRRWARLDSDVNPPWLTVFEGRYAIFRSQYIYIKDTIKFLNHLSLSHFGTQKDTQREYLHMRTIMTSGTIKKLKHKKKALLRKFASAGDHQHRRK